MSFTVSPLASGPQLKLPVAVPHAFCNPNDVSGLTIQQATAPNIDSVKTDVRLCFSIALCHCYPEVASQGTLSSGLTLGVKAPSKPSSGCNF